MSSNQALTASAETRIGTVRAEAGPLGLRRVLLPEVGIDTLKRLPLHASMVRTLTEGKLAPSTLLPDIGLAPVVVGQDKLLCGRRPNNVIVDPREVLECVLRDLRLFFEGELSPPQLRFDYPADFSWCADFTRSIMTGMTSIMPGAVTTYGALAAAAGSPRAARAVGSVVGANPLAVVVPCHRVIGSAGALTGYGGGLPLKVALLALEVAAS